MLNKSTLGSIIKISVAHSISLSRIVHIKDFASNESVLQAGNVDNVSTYDIQHDNSRQSLRGAVNNPWYS